MRTLLAVHLFSETNNIGDRMCCPLDYISVGAFNIQKVDIREYSGGDAIIGGGGLLHPGLDEQLHAALKVKARRVIWGIGTNYHGRTDLAYPDWISQFDLVGTRDCLGPNPHPAFAHHVPCASCLSPLFDKERGISQEAVIYEHAAFPITLSTNLPRLNNAGKTGEEFGRALDFIGSAKIVITNSYHGAYWAQLLGRTPVLFAPFSNRFLFFERVLPVIKNPSDDWRSAAETFVRRSAETLDVDLRYCRLRNKEFLDKVRLLFEPLQELT